MTMDVSNAAITYEVFPWQGELPPTVYAAWQQLIEVIPETPVFSYPDWVAGACLEGAMCPWQVVIVRHGTRLVGLLPLRRRTPWSAEVITLLSPGFPPLLVDPTEEAAAWTGFSAWLHSRTGIGLLSLGRHNDPQRIAGLARGAVEHRLPFQARKANVSVWAELPESWEAFLAGLAHSVRDNVRNAEPRLCRQVPNVSIELITDADAGARAADTLIRLSSHQWQNRGKKSTLHDPPVAAFYRRMLVWGITQGCALLAALRVEDRTVAVATLFHLPGQEAAYYHAVGRDLEALPAKFSPGIILLARLIRVAIARGARRLNMGQGVLPYKLWIGGQSYQQWECFVARSAWDALVQPRLDPAIHHLRRLSGLIARADQVSRHEAVRPSPPGEHPAGMRFNQSS